MILSGPENITVMEGDFATFNCTIKGSNQVPYWNINGSSYSNDLPDRHSYRAVSKVSIFDNGTTYQCGVFGSPPSDIAILIIVERG